MTTSVPFLDYLAIREEEADGDMVALDSVAAGATHRYIVDFREEHLGNPLIRTFHGGVLASVGEAVAAMHLARESGAGDAAGAALGGALGAGGGALPECATMTFDYLRPAFAKTLVAVPHTVRAGRRITTVSVQLRQEGQLVCIGRFLFPVTR